ncbi:MAG: DHH family phosphoesterase [Spirochaetales bacterium]|nr:DHH family phosphoesterase [Spirochaetales bacterium]
MEIDYNFNGSLKLTDVVEDFFYSPSTGLYVFRHPLVVDERVLAAAADLSIRVQASPEKWLVNTRLADCLKILSLLGSTALSLPEYFQVRKDVIEAEDSQMLDSLESDRFIEMLSTVFIRDSSMIHHPEPLGPLKFTGEEIPVKTPEGRYGWIDPGKVSLETGLPEEVGKIRNIEDNTFKYWDTHTDIGRQGVLMAMRGFVTSVGKISIDLGIPADAISHKLSIRECRKTLPSSALDENTLEEAKAILSRYYASVEDGTFFTQDVPWTADFLSFIGSRRQAITSAKDAAALVLREDIYDVLGVLRIRAEGKNEGKEPALKSAALEFSGISGGQVTDDMFLDFVRTRKDVLSGAVAEKRGIVFVMGHRNPDTDTVVSALGESFRQYLLHGDGDAVFVPVVPGNSIPEEISELLGKDVSGCLVLTDSSLYKMAKNSGRPEWIMVDRNVGPEQPDTRAIIDHHYPSDVCLMQQIPRRIIFAGSTTALVAQKLYGMGIDIPPLLAGIFHGAALMDTENRFTGKMTMLDEIVMDSLKRISGMDDEAGFYRRLMKKLVSCYDPDELFYRDYKEDWSFFGFAVAKGIEIMDERNRPVIRRLTELARINNTSQNLPLTLVKIVDYDRDGETIRRERACPVFSDEAAPEMKDAVFKTIITVIKHESGKNVMIKTDGDCIEYWGVGTQLSRKKLAPVLELVVNAFNRYFYSPSTGLYFKRDFLRMDRKIEEIALRDGIKPHVSGEGVLVGNPAELKFFLQETGFLCASPSEFFKAYFDAVRIRDQRMQKHLTNSRYLETLDAIVENRKVLVEHPVIRFSPPGFDYEGGTKKLVTVLKGEPGLINPEKIDLSTGLPLEVEDPRQYGTGLWRYWSPDSDCVWVLRSTIFAYDMPALDLKFHYREALPRLSIRPCTTRIIHPKVDVVEKDNVIDVVVVE